ncbi:MAG TPA: PP2C family protein-serine/threonine phosphatase [Anaerolineae bacterium]|nr:PP2C family protein-serine/threonine phosphatase [Anaerolineae bacterium]
MVPLHRLIERENAETLVREFAALLPGVDFALVDPDGRVLAGAGEWPRSPASAEALTLTLNKVKGKGKEQQRGTPAMALALVKDERIVHADGLTILPLWVDAALVGALIAKESSPLLSSATGEGPGVRALRCLYACASMLIAQTIETRDIARETLERYREINLLYQIGETIGSCLDAAEIPGMALAEAQRVIRAEAGAVLLPASDDGDAWEVKAGFGEDADFMLLSDLARPLIERARVKGIPDIVERAPGDSPLPRPFDPSAPLRAGFAQGRLRSEPAPSPARGQGFSSLLCAPLKTRERTLGALLLGRSAGRAAFTASDEKLAMAIAGQAAIAIEKAWLHRQEIERQRMEEELSVGRRIQLSLLPQACPDSPGWAFAASYRAAREVSGDFYDFFEAPDDPARLRIVIGDVTGKGVPAALMMAFSRALIRAESTSGRHPAEVLERVNRAIIWNRSRLLLTAFYAALDRRSGRMTFASGGHDWPLWLKAATGECIELETRGVVLGALNEIPLVDRVIDLAPGDLVVCFTDGVTEAQNAEGQMFDLERLKAVVKANRHAGAQRALTAIVEAVEGFVGDTPQSDDLTVVVVKRTSRVEEASHGAESADRG